MKSGKRWTPPERLLTNTTMKPERVVQTPVVWGTSALIGELCLFSGTCVTRILVTQDSANNKGAQFRSLLFTIGTAAFISAGLHFLWRFQGYLSIFCSHVETELGLKWLWFSPLALSNSGWSGTSSLLIPASFTFPLCKPAPVCWTYQGLSSFQARTSTPLTPLCWLINSNIALSHHLKWIRCSSGILSKCFYKSSLWGFSKVLLAS